ncbi:hypothetical protein ACPPVO_20890 [Dactylosporangium sp. McL0621]|uniref:hypothetical protein n=1 Tax=Dactylosporangium sp. McL0621 TaxID=3415678 RepID=UPI003CF6F1F5
MIFPLGEVLVLVEHAAAAPANAEPVADEAPGPALLLVAEDGIYLLSNGLPQLDAAPGQPQVYGMRAVYAEGCGPGTPAAVRTAAIGFAGATLTGVPIPLAVLFRLRAATADYDLFTITLSATRATICAARRRPGGAAHTTPADGGG